MKVKQFAKAIMPSLVALLTAVTYSLAQGKIDTQTLILAGVGLVGSVLTYFVPNAAPEIQALEQFAPLAAGHPDPVVGLVAVDSVTSAPQAPAPQPAPSPAPAPPTPPAAA